jgi:glycosyltransferase involved in cell wall biosynthesis
LDPELPVFEILESSSHFTVGDQDVARAATGLYGDPCLVWVGRLSPVKDPLMVLDALAQAIPQLRDPHLWCYYTQAPLHREVTRRLEQDDRLAQRTHLQGRVPHAQIEAVMRSADFFVTGSRREGSGYAVIEAMACGTPPIVTDIPAFRSLTDGGTVGALVPPGDPSAMALALTEWSLQDRRSVRSMVRTHFDRALSFRVLGGELRAAYRKLAGLG